MTSSDQPQPEAPARRPGLRQSDIIAMLLSKGGGEHSLVSLSRSARGVTQVEVTVRTGEGDGPTTAEEASALAQRIYDALIAKYPMPEGGGA